MDQSLNQQSNMADAPFIVFEPRRVLSSFAAFARTHTAELLSGAMLAIMGMQMFAVIWRKSITIDESVLIPSAYYHLADGNFQLVNEHPAFPKLVAAVPLLFVQPNEYVRKPTEQFHDASDLEWVQQTRFWDDNLDRIDSLSFWPRLAMIVLTIALGVLIFHCTRSMFGPRAAVLAVTMFSLEPTLVGHGRVVHTDVPAAFGYLLFFWALYSYTNERTYRRAVFVGAAAALAILSKFSMLMTGFVLAGVFLFLFWQSAKRRTVLVQALIVLVSIIVVIDAAYFFQRQPLDPADLAWISGHFPDSRAGLSLLAQSLSYFLPKDFVMGIVFQFWHNREGHSAGLLGMYSEKGWWYYFPVAFALKTTLPFLLLSVGAFGWATFEFVRHRDRRFFWLLLPIMIYMVFVLFSHIDIGVRYLLPMFPFLIILGAYLLDTLWRKRSRLGGLVVVLALVWMGVEAIRAFPNHISYMNQLASRAPHWWYLSDSNVEWGDDLRDLARYLHERGETRVLDATLGGFAILHFYGIERVDALEKQHAGENEPKYLAIGASYMNGSTIPSGQPGTGRETVAGRVNFFDEYRHRQPEAIIGDSIYVFRMR
jgi:4-amino-4-deoxy-L-arabinose transferase-like glycosyltransferase